MPHKAIVDALFEPRLGKGGTVLWKAPLEKIGKREAWEGRLGLPKGQKKFKNLFGAISDVKHQYVRMRQTKQSSTERLLYPNVLNLILIMGSFSLIFF